jgi:hypothetical protein
MTRPLIASKQYKLLLAILLFYASINPLVAAPIVEREPNDVIIDAHPISPLVSIGGVIDTATDNDYFAFRAELGETIQADILALGFRASNKPGSNLNAKLSLLGTDGTTVLIEDIPAGAYDDPFVEYTFTASGTYYLRVTDVNNTGGADHIYVLSVEKEKPENMGDPAHWITPPELPSIDALIHPPGDIDEYKFQGNANQIVTIDIDSAVFNPTNPAAEIIIQLMNNEYDILASDAYDPVSDPVDPYIQYTLPIDGTYRINISERRSFVGTSNTFYQLSVELGPATLNNTFATANPVGPPHIISGVLAPSGDSDFYGFNSTQISSISADIDASGGLHSLMTGDTLTLHDTSGAITQNSSSPDPLLTSSINTGPYAVSISGSSSGLSEDAYYTLYLDTDYDNDGFLLPLDTCPNISNIDQVDSDNDGVGDACDSCPTVFGPDQSDFDNDNMGDACDPDDDDDGLNDDFERSIGTDPFNVDTDDDGLSDYEEVNFDGDPTTLNYFLDLNPLNPDSDFDGVSDLTDTAPLNYNFNDGDLAPLGNPDGIINAADYLIAQRIALGLLVPSGLELSHGDLYPVGAPDGIINIQDMILIMRSL